MRRQCGIRVCRHWDKNQWDQGGTVVPNLSRKMDYLVAFCGPKGGGRRASEGLQHGGREHQYVIWLIDWLIAIQCYPRSLHPCSGANGGQTTYVSRPRVTSSYEDYH